MPKASSAAPTTFLGAGRAAPQYRPGPQIFGDRERRLYRLGMRDVANAAPMRLGIIGDAAPSQASSPSAGGSRPAIIRNRLDLPAPFGPARTSAPPLASWNERLRRKSCARRERRPSPRPKTQPSAPRPLGRSLAGKSFRGKAGIRNGGHWGWPPLSSATADTVPEVGGSGSLAGDPCPNRYRRNMATLCPRSPSRRPSSARSVSSRCDRPNDPGCPIPPQRRLHPTNPAK